jgi:hypothetical protein
MKNEHRELVVEPVELQRVGPPTGLVMVGSHLRRKFNATNADGPLGDRTLPPRRGAAFSCQQKMMFPHERSDPSSLHKPHNPEVSVNASQ